jgi:hypothetical protein
MLRSSQNRTAPTRRIAPRTLDSAGTAGTQP